MTFFNTLKNVFENIYVFIITLFNQISSSFKTIIDQDANVMNKAFCLLLILVILYFLNLVFKSMDSIFSFFKKIFISIFYAFRLVFQIVFWIITIPFKLINLFFRYQQIA
ncbi:MAG: hypothetical protein Q8763_02475, partial [Candidatus Phytoplasma australasiaticum]|nr:hypothetical protein [Candidatus Phytoplasma australasiaticum]